MSPRPTTTLSKGKCGDRVHEFDGFFLAGGGRAPIPKLVVPFHSTKKKKWRKSEGNDERIPFISFHPIPLFLEGRKKKGGGM